MHRLGTLNFSQFSLCGHQMLEETRKALIGHIRENEDLEVVRKSLSAWFSDIQEWESKDTFETAFGEGRMTARDLPKKAAMKKFPVNVFNNGKNTGKATISLNASLEGIWDRVEAKNFLEKLKNEKGLHDLSAVLLKPTLAISKQVFGVSEDSATVFAPLPHEDDLIAFDMVAELAKKDITSPLYWDYVQIRAKFTRIKYGQDSDMHSGFAVLVASDTKMKVKYGFANVMGGMLGSALLQQRHLNALQYRKKILESKKFTGENNEVIVAYRSHAGDFPMYGVRSKDRWDLFTRKEKVGELSDEGKVTTVI